jgi:Flp pilus assembly protein TadG
VVGLRNEKGQSLVEFAIILPVVMLILMGIIEFGLMINCYLKVENAAREGARTGIVSSANVDIQEAVVRISPNLVPENLTVNVTPAEGYRKSGEALTVEVIYKYEMTVPIISNIFGRTVDLKAQTSMRIE